MNMALNSLALLIYTICSLFVCVAGYKAWGGVGSSLVMVYFLIAAWYVVYAFCAVSLGRWSGIINLPITIVICFWMFSDGNIYEEYQAAPSMAQYYKKEYNNMYHEWKKECPIEFLQIVKSDIIHSHAKALGNDGYDYSEADLRKSWGLTIQWFANHNYPIDKPEQGDAMGFYEKPIMSSKEYFANYNKSQDDKWAKEDETRFLNARAFELDARYKIGNYASSNLDTDKKQELVDDAKHFEWLRTWNIRKSIHDPITMRDGLDMPDGTIKRGEKRTPALLPSNITGLSDEQLMKLMFP